MAANGSSGLGGYSFAAPTSNALMAGWADEKKKRKLQGQEGADGGETRLNARQSDNLDYRTRSIEAMVMRTFKVPKTAGDAHAMVLQMLAAVARYNENARAKEEKHLGHPWGHCRHTVALAWIKWLSDEADKGVSHVQGLFAPLAAAVQRHDELAQIAKLPQIAEQVCLLQHFGSKLSDRKEMDWMSHCEITLTKKADAYLIRYAVHGSSIFTVLNPLLECSILAVGGGTEELQGSAPRGPLYFRKDNKNKK